jgi:hypothetical protein
MVFPCLARVGGPLKGCGYEGAVGRIDRVLGLDVGVASDEVAVFKRTVVEVIRSEAPQVAGKLAQKFLAAADDA